MKYSAIRQRDYTSKIPFFPHGMLKFP